jgi:hypothetical protein
MLRNEQEELLGKLKSQWIRAPYFTEEENLLEFAIADLLEEMGDGTSGYWREAALSKQKERLEIKKKLTKLT